MNKFLFLFIITLCGCSYPKGTWKITVEEKGYYEVWSGGRVVHKEQGPETFYTTGPPKGSDEYPWWGVGLPGVTPGDGTGYIFQHTDNKSAVVCPYFCSTCEKIN